METLETYLKIHFDWIPLKNILENPNPQLLEAFENIFIKNPR